MREHYVLRLQPPNDFEQFLSTRMCRKAEPFDAAADWHIAFHRSKPCALALLCVRYDISRRARVGVADEANGEFRFPQPTLREKITRRPFLHHAARSKHDAW